MAESTTLQDSLFKLIEAKNYKQLELFVKRNKIVDSTFADYDAVVFACSRWDTQALDVLLTAGARPHDERQTSKFNDTPMYHALLLNDAGMASTLIRHGFTFRKIDISDSSPAEMLIWATKTSQTMVDLVLSAYIRERYNPPDRYHLAPSHIACMRGRSSALKKFLQFDNSVVSLPIQKECDVNLSGASPLHLAVMYGQYDHAKMLLERGAYPLSLNDSSSTSMHYAAYRQDKDMVKLLFEYLNVKRMRANPRDSSGISLFHIACWLGPAQVLEDFIRGGQYDVNGAINKITFDHRNREFFGYTPLHFAVKSGDEVKVRMLLANGALPSAVSGKENHSKATPLTLAVKLNCKEVIDELTKVLCLHDLESVTHDVGFANLYYAIFENTSFSNLPGPGNWVKCSPLHYAVARRDAELVEELLKAGANVDKQDDRGLTPLMLACILTTAMTHQIKSIVIKVGRGKVSEKTKKWFNREDSPQSRIVNLLLEHKADVNLADREGKTALVFLTMNSLFNWVEVDVTEDTKNTLFAYSYHIVMELLRRGASVTPVCSGGSTLIHFLCGVDNMSDLFVTNEIARIRLLQLYVEAGCDVNARTETGRTALYMALNCDLFYLADKLIKSGADIHAKTNRGETALHAVTGSFASRTRMRFVAYLLAMGIDINAKMAEQQSTVLHLSVRLSLNNNDALVALLLEHGADVDATDSRNATALHYAIAADNKIMAEALVYYGADVDMRNVVDETPLSLAGKMVRDVNKWEAALTVARFIYRMRAIGRRYAPENERFVENLRATRINDVGFHPEPINDEIARLKSRAVVHGSTKKMYSLLTRSVHEMRHYVRNEEFVRIVQSSAFLNEFPLYGPIIVARTRRAMTRQRVFDSATLAISVMIGFDVPNIVDTIAKHMSDFELRTLVESSIKDPETSAGMVLKRKQNSLSVKLNLLDDDSSNECSTTLLALCKKFCL